MTFALIAGPLLLLSLGGAAWVWLVLGFRKEGLRGAAARVALQISSLCFLWGVLRGDPILGLYKALLPPLVGVELVELAGFRSLLTAALWAAAPWGALALALGLGLAWRPLRPWAPGLGGAALMLALVMQGETISRQAMCATAAAQGLTEVRRLTLSQSLARLPGEAPHGLARDAAGAVWIWSYRAMAWELHTAAAPLVTAGLTPAPCAP